MAKEPLGARGPSVTLNPSINDVPPTDSDMRRFKKYNTTVSRFDVKGN